MLEAIGRVVCVFFCFISVYRKSSNSPDMKDWKLLWRLYEESGSNLIFPNTLHTEFSITEVSREHDRASVSQFHGYQLKVVDIYS